MQGPRAERFVVFNLRLLAISFAVVGILFIAVPSGVLDVISDVGEWFGNHNRAPHTQEDLWLALACAYMVVITGICLVAQADPVRYRPLLLVLAAGKTASSLGSLAFFVIDEQVFIYLLNFLVDGFLAVLALALWALAGRIGRPAEPG
jgi:nitric oxide reductase large subunit